MKYRGNEIRKSLNTLLLQSQFSKEVKFEFLRVMIIENMISMRVSASRSGKNKKVIENSLLLVFYPERAKE